MKRTILIVMAAVMSFGTAFAKDQSVAYIDMQYILKNLPQYEQANEQLTMLSKRWQKEVDAAQQEARVMATNYQTEQIFLWNSNASISDRKASYTRNAKLSSALSRTKYTRLFRIWQTRNALILSRTVLPTRL